jgi:hypothetical protein
MRTTTCTVALLAGLAAAAPPAGALDQDLVKDGFVPFETRAAAGIAGGFAACQDTPFGRRLAQAIDREFPNNDFPVIQVLAKGAQFNCFRKDQGVALKPSADISLYLAPDKQQFGDISPVGGIVKIINRDDPVDPYYLVPTKNGMKLICVPPGC